MHKTITVDGKEYTIIPIPPALSPYSLLYSELMKSAKTAATLQDAERLTKDLEQAVDRILSATVTPKPSKAHEIQALVAVFDLTSKVMEDAGLFRQAKQDQPDSSKGGSASPSPAQTPKRVPGTKS